MGFSAVVGYFPKHQFLSALLFSRQQNTSSNTTGHVLSVISHVAKHLPRSTCERLIGEWPRETAQWKAQFTFVSHLRVILHGGLLGLQNPHVVCHLLFR